MRLVVSSTSSSSSSSCKRTSNGSTPQVPFPRSPLDGDRQVLPGREPVKPVCGHHGRRFVPVPVLRVHFRDISDSPDVVRESPAAPGSESTQAPTEGSGPAWMNRSERTNVLRLRTLGALRDVELDLLVLVEGLVALRLDRGVVNEDVVAAVLLSDEAETLLGVEPLDGALSHAVVLLLLKASDRHFGGPARCG